jgi:glutamyl-tRNA reductase
LIVDLALPRDVEPRVAELPGVRVVGLAELGAELAGLGVGTDVEAVTTIVQAEVARYLQSVAAGEVAPTVVALRAYAEELLQSELVRLRARLNGHVDDRVAAEVERTLHRVVEKILHRPTVRVKSLSTQADGALYAAALRALFDLDLDDRTGEPPVTDVTEALAANADLLLLLGESPVTGLGGR